MMPCRHYDGIAVRAIGAPIPLDASPKYRARCQRIKDAIEQHGSHNAYYLCNAKCGYHLTNRDDVGMLRFRFEGTLLTDASDQRSEWCDLEVELLEESCDWITEPIVKWFAKAVQRSVMVEFDRYIEAGDLEQAKKRVAQIQAASDESGGFIGMYL